MLLLVYVGWFQLQGQLRRVFLCSLPQSVVNAGFLLPVSRLPGHRVLHRLLYFANQRQLWEYIVFAERRLCGVVYWPWWMDSSDFNSEDCSFGRH